MNKTLAHMIDNARETEAKKICAELYAYLQGIVITLPPDTPPNYVDDLVRRAFLTATKDF